ncbi:MAG: hypothetical protein ISP91_14850 [Pseudomonadales bacterium]|jgi:hypothetical protein|nr:hypothetical protein [Pseudomonadales bacterium]
MLVSVPRKQLESGETIQLDLDKVRAAIEGNREGTRLIYIDQTESLGDLSVDDVIKFATGTSREVEDEMPVGMEDFKAAVQRIRRHTKLLKVNADD